MEFWLDTSSHLILRIQADPGAPNWDAGMGMKATAFSDGETVDPAQFAWAGPAGAFDEANPPPSRTLAVGEVIPDVTGPLLGGGTFHSSALLGRPAAIFIWGPGVRGPDLRILAAAVAHRASRLGAAVIYEGSADEARAETTDVGFSGPVVVDEGSALNPLGLNWWPVLALLDADGKLQSLSHSVTAPAELDAMFDALIAGTPIPTPTWSIRPSTAPDAASWTLVVGLPAPDWTVPLPGGGSMTAHGFAGKRTVVYYGMPQGGDDYDRPRAAMLDALYRAQLASPGSLRVVIVVADPYTTDAAAAALARLGIALPVVPDRDGTIGRAWGLIYFDDLVFLDDVGRVLSFGGGVCQDTATLLARLAGGGPMPSPTVALSAPGCP